MALCVSFREIEKAVKYQLKTLPYLVHGFVPRRHVFYIFQDNFDYPIKSPKI